MSLPFAEGEITTELIQQKAAELGLTIDDADQLAFLTSLGSFDLQASPGCGKTTLTALKLCVLASVWNSNTQGVCVLSHTNVAKDQIVEALRNDRDGRRFLTYPHFIGTIHGFVDTFLAFPHFRSIGQEVRVVDDKIYERVAYKELNKDLYPTLQTQIRPPHPRSDIDSLVRTAHYRWDGDEMKLYGYHNSKLTIFPFGQLTDSAKQFSALKKAVSEKGVFTFEDMFAFGHDYLSKNPSVIEAVRRRFPFIVIDEMQDTDTMQEGILNRTFDHESCVMQRVGDINQRIYSESDEADGNYAQFPRAGHLSLPRSLRFGDGIAKIASRLTWESPQELQGNPGQPDFAPLLIVFEEDSVDQVLNAFAVEVATTLPEELRLKSPVKAIGYRRSGSANEFPKQIQCYFPSFRPKATVVSKPSGLMEAVSKVRSNPDMLWKERTEILMEACCTLLIAWPYSIHSYKPTPSRLKNVLSKAGFNHTLAVRKSLLGLYKADLTDETCWNTAVQALLESLLRALNLNEPSENAESLCAYKVAIVEEAKESVCESAVFAVNDVEVTVELATIHASKGETHSATLVLECFDKVHDLQEVLPILVGAQDQKRIERTRSIPPAIRRTFVAITRPRHLLAVAIRKTHITGHIKAFEDSGWKTIDLTTN